VEEWRYREGDFNLGTRRCSVAAFQALYLPSKRCKAKFTLEKATEAQRRSGGIALLFL
jgi:hypothetical protein